MPAALLAAAASSDVSRSPLNQGEQEMTSMSWKKPTEALVTPALLYSCAGYLSDESLNDQTTQKTHFRKVLSFT